MHNRKNALKIEDLHDTSGSFRNISPIQLKPVYIVVALVFSIIVFQLGSMQIINGQRYLAASNQNYKNRNIIRAPRGVIYDVKGEKIAYNENVYSVFIDKSEFDFDENGLLLSSIVKMPIQEIESRIKNSDTQRVTLKKGANHDEYLDFSVRIKDIEGAYTVSETSRKYIDPFAYSHITGYIGDPSAEDVTDRVDQHSVVGKTGLERLYDNELRGYDGVQINEIEIGTGNNKVYVPSTPQPGDNVYLNINNDWQNLAYNVLKDRVVAVNGLGGAFTIMEADTGKVVVMASYPSFDVNKFSEGISYEDFNNLINDPGSPLLERNTAVALPPGSTFKVVTGSIFLQENAITDKTLQFSDGCMTLPGGRLEFCESFKRKLGQLDIYGAIKQSSNIFFCKNGIEFEKNFGGIDVFKKYTDKFGIGKLTGIDLINETSGAMASPALKEKIYGEPWYVGDMCNTVIGQGMITATPIQMLSVTASIVNGGKIYRPQILDKIMDNDGNVIKSFKVDQTGELPISTENLSIIQKAMRAAVTDYNGGLRQLSDVEGEVMGKTGTATAPVYVNGKLYNEPHAWVIGAFNKNRKKYAFVVNIAHGGWGEQAVAAVKRFIQNAN